MLKNLWNNFSHAFSVEFKTQQEVNEYYSVYKFYG